MEVNFKKFGIDGLYVKASGRLDLDNAVEYGQKIKVFIEDNDEVLKEVVLEFGEISFISSFGLKILLELYKQLKGQNGVLKLKNVSDEIMNSFKLVGFDKFLIFE